MQNNTNGHGDKPKQSLALGYLPSGDVVKENLTNAGATVGQVDAVLGLLNYGRDHKLGHTTALAKRINVSPSTLSRVFAGNYGADLTNLVGDINHFLRLERERETLGEHRIVRDLRVAKDVAELCELARITGTMAILFGPNQSGKSWALEKIYTPAHNHGRTIFVRMPTGGGTRLLLEEILKACGISERKSYGEMKQRVFRYFDPQTLLVIDEVHQAMIGRSLKTITIETIREIHDVTGCAVVLCGTDVLPEMFDDPRFKKFLGQTGNRGVLRRLIPTKPYNEDVVALCKAYGFPAELTAKDAIKIDDADASDLVKKIAATNGIGKLCKYFQLSHRLASGRKEPIGWAHFLATHATLTSWEKGEAMKRADS